MEAATSYLTTRTAGTADRLTNHVIDFKLSKSKHAQKSEQSETVVCDTMVDTQHHTFVTIHRMHNTKNTPYCK